MYQSFRQEWQLVGPVRSYNLKGNRHELFFYEKNARHFMLGKLVSCLKIGNKVGA